MVAYLERLLFWKMFGILWNYKHNINYKNSSDTGLFRKGDTRKHLLDITKESLKKC